MGDAPTVPGPITLFADSVIKNGACYVLEHFSRFVPPGSVRVASSEMEQLASIAFLTSQHTMVLVVSNTGNFAMPFAVKYHDNFFQSTLPPESVRTYVW
jgi:glucosylceramidase